LLVNATEEDVDEQIDCEAGVAVAVGLGFAVMITLVEAPVQELEVGVTE
jgi:hypothetical protein